MRKETIYKITSVLVLSLPLITLGADLISVTASAKDIINGIGKMLGAIAVVVGVVFLVIGIFKFATSGGDPRALDEAKINIVWGVVAIIIGIGLTKATDILSMFGVTITN